jgi:hypothetical protein
MLMLNSANLGLADGLTVSLNSGITIRSRGDYRLLSVRHRTIFVLVPAAAAILRTAIIWRAVIAPQRRAPDLGRVRSRNKNWPEITRKTSVRVWGGKKCYRSM